MSYSIESTTDGCYPGTTVLRNRLDIRDEKLLDEAEALMTYINGAKLEENPLAGEFDFSHYKAIHRFLFSELYDWAGEIRSVDISKKGTVFCPATEIEDRAGQIFKRLKAHNLFINLPKDDFVDEITDFYCVTNTLHPFREGNGRTQRAFLTQLIRNAGYSINFSELDMDLLMVATIQAAQGVTDLLKQFFDEAVHES